MKSLFILTTLFLCSHLCFAQSNDKALQSYLQIFIVDPPKPLNWDSPKSLLETTAINASWIDYSPEGRFAPRLDYAPNGHFVVHFVYPNRKEGPLDILTGMSRANKAKTAEDTLLKGYGLSAMLLTFPGELDQASDDVKELDEAQRAGRLSSLVIPIEDEQAKKMERFLENWIDFGSYHNYGGGKNVGAGEGAGCADFAMYFMALATDGHAPLESWIRTKYLPYSLMMRSTGGTESAISILSMIRGPAASAWGIDDTNGREFITPDPELVSAWIRTELENPDGTSFAGRTVMMDQPYASNDTSDQAKKILLDVFDKSGKSKEDEATSLAVWNRISLSTAQHDGNYFLDNPF